MSTKGSLGKTGKVACNICGKEYTRPGLQGHIRFVHYDKDTLKADLADFSSSLQCSNNPKIADLEAQLSEIIREDNNSKATIAALQAKLSDVQSKCDNSESQAGKLSIELEDIRKTPFAFFEICRNFIDNLDINTWHAI